MTEITHGRLRIKGTGVLNLTETDIEAIQVGANAVLPVEDEEIFAVAKEIRTRLERVSPKGWGLRQKYPYNNR